MNELLTGMVGPHWGLKKKKNWLEGFTHLLVYLYFSGVHFSENCLREHTFIEPGPVNSKLGRELLGTERQNR